MKKIQKLSTCLLLLLLALSMILTSCVSPSPDPGTTDPGTTESGTHDHDGEQTTAPTQTCKHTNTMLRNESQPTCSTEGYTGDTVCADCGTMIAKGTSIATVAHQWNDGAVTKDPTCLAEGTKTFTCTVCGGTRQEPVAKVGHQDVYHDALDGTHTHTCSTCTMSENEEHTPVDASGTYHVATCTEAAYTEYVCAKCNGTYKVYSTTELATDHAWGEWTTTPATCTEKGSQVRHCSKCTASDTITLPENAKAHNFTEESRTNATCTSQGNVHYVCACGATKDEALPLLAHSYGEAHPGTEAGWTYQECTSCGYQLSKFDASTVVSATLSANSVENISAEQALEVSVKNAAIQFPKEVVSQMKEAAAEISVKADIMDDTSKSELLENQSSNLTDDQKARLENVPIYDFGVTANDEAISNFNAAVTVTLPYTLQDGEDPDGIVIWYVADDGTITEVSATYDADTEQVTFTVEHFSFYAVAYKETQAMKCKRGQHDWETVETVAASCGSYGYTRKECTYCHTSTLDNIVNKLAHSYGDPVQPTVTCEEGGYVTKTCEHCGDVLQLEYVRALGHKPDGVATCTKESVCKTCHQVITPALGHKWSEWETVVEPTDVNTGLRRRYCQTCGEVDENKLAATGTVTAIQYESYQELLEALFKNVLNLGSGTIAFENEQNGMNTKFQATVEDSDGSYKMLIQVTVTYGERTYCVDAAYRNGVLVYQQVNGDDTEGYVASIEELLTYGFGADFDLAMNYAEQVFDYLDTYAEAYLGQTKELLNTYSELYGAKIDEALEAAGCQYRVADLNKILDSLETVYAYAALKLGYETDLVMHESVRVPSKQDWHTVLSALMKATETDSGTLYTADAAELVDAADVVLTWFEQRLESPLSDVIYELIGADLSASYPEITDWATLVTFIRTNLPGTMTVKQLTDKLITVIENNEKGDIDDIYYALNFCIFTYENMNSQTPKSPEELLQCFMSGEFQPSMTVQSILEQNAEVTLNQLLAGLGIEGMESLDALYDTVLVQMIPSVIFGEIPVGGDSDTVITVADIVGQAQGYLNALDITANISIELDSSGNLLGFSIHQNLSMSKDEETATLYKLTFAIDRDDTVKVTLPDELANLTENKVTVSFDTDGNMLISGLNSNFEYSFEIEGGKKVAYQDVVELDEDMTAQMGFDVYRLKKQYWNSTSTDYDNIYLKNETTGKLYLATETVKESQTVIGQSIPFTDFFANPESFLPQDGDEPYGEYRGWDDETNEEVSYPAYETAIGYVMQVDGEWQLINSNGLNWNRMYTYDSESGEEVVTLYCWQTGYAPYTAAVNSMVLDSIEPYYYYDELPNVYRAYYTMEGFDGTVRVWIATTNNQNFSFVQLEQTDEEITYTLGAEATDLPAYERLTVIKPSWNENVILPDGYTPVALTVLVPSYYAPYDGIYFSLYDAPFVQDISVGNYDTVTLADGRLLYVKKTMSGFLWGYISAGENLYVPAIVDAETNEIYYRYSNYQSKSYRVYYDNLFDVKDYLTVNADGTYKIDAELIRALKAYCTEEGDAFSIIMQGTYETENASYSSFNLLMQNTVPTVLDDPFASIGGGSSVRPDNGLSYDFDWSILYGDSNDYSYRFETNADGTVSVVLSNGAKLQIEVDFSTRVPLPEDATGTYNEELSQSTGLNIYTFNKKEQYYNSYVLSNGKYYYYSTEQNRICIGCEALDLADGFIGSNWRVYSLQFEYASNTEGENIPIYYGRVELLNAFSDWSSTMLYNLHFQIKDGVLYVLQDAKYVDGNGSVLQYEGVVPANEYFASLTVKVPSTEGDWYPYDYFYGDKRVYLTMVDIYEGETLLGSVYVAYYLGEDGARRYITVQSIEEQCSLILGDEVTDLPTVTETSTYTDEYPNGSFTFANVTWVNQTSVNYVKIAGKYYQYYSLNWALVSENDFMLEMGEMRDPVFGVKDADGNWTYYQTMSGDEFTNALEAFDPTGYESEFLFGYEDGSEAYVFSGYSLDHLTTETLDDGSVYYARPAEACGYLKLANGKYIRVDRTDRNGEEEFYCSGLEMVYLTDSEEIFEYLGLSDYITTVSENEVCFSAGILEALSEYQMDAYFDVYRNGEYIGRFSYYDLEMQF